MLNFILSPNPYYHVHWINQCFVSLSLWYGSGSLDPHGEKNGSYYDIHRDEENFNTLSNYYKGFIAYIYN